jgi:hypothetical protein
VLVAVGCAGRRAPESTVEVFHPPPVVEGLLSDPPVTGLDAEPRAPLPAQIAVYARSPEVAEELAEALQGLQGVHGTYVIPGYVVDGRSLYPTWADSYGPRTPLELDRLRELAAMAHCDVLVVADAAWRQEVRANAWVALSPLLLPVLATPFLRLEDHTSIDAHVLDVRTGHLYGRVAAELTEARGPTTIYATYRPELQRRQREALVDEVRAEVADLLWRHLLTPRSADGGWSP